MKPIAVNAASSARALNSNTRDPAASETPP